jgi:hypothetical protein
MSWTIPVDGSRQELQYPLPPVDHSGKHSFYPWLSQRPWVQIPTWSKQVLEFSSIQGGLQRHGSPFKCLFRFIGRPIVCLLA